MIIWNEDAVGDCFNLLTNAAEGSSATRRRIMSLIDNLLYPFISMPENPRLLNLGMNGILSKRSQVEPGEAEQIPT